MALTVEAAVVTKKGAANPFNTDSVNAAGKVWPAEVIHSEKGVRVAGTKQGAPYYVLAGSETKGTAQSAADLFQNCVAKFREDGSNCAEMLSDYLNAFAKVLIESGFDSSDCSFAVLAGFNDTVYIGKSGDSRVYTYYDGVFTEISPEMKDFPDGKSSCGVAQCRHVAVGDLFILLSGKVASVFPNGLLKAACERSEGDVKKIAGIVSSQAVKYGYQDAVSAIVVKVTDVEAPAEAPVPAQEDAAPIDAAPIDAPAQTPDEIAAAISAAAAEKEALGGTEPGPVEEEPAQPVKKGKRAGIIILIFLLAVAALAVMYFFVSGASEKYFGSRESTTESTSEPTETESETEPESESESESTTEEESAESEATTEETTEEITTARETTTRSSTTTTQRATETTTNEPSSSESTTNETQPTTNENEIISDETDPASTESNVNEGEEQSSSSDAPVEEPDTQNADPQPGSDEGDTGAEDDGN
mgnify:CR=1 FL=1